MSNVNQQGNGLYKDGMVPLFIDGEFRQSASAERIAVTNPATDEVLCHAPCATADEMEQAIASARAAFKTWKEVALPERARLMMRYQALLKEHHDELAEILAKETGKTFEDAKGDVWRGIEVVEQAANVPSLMMGETAENVARAIFTCVKSRRIARCTNRGVPEFAQDHDGHRRNAVGYPR